jgi:hypothetical protein
MLEQQLIVGKTYRFTFKPEFERHGVCTTPGLTCLHKGGGVFTVKQITTFADLARAQNGDLYGSFFEPLGMSKDDMNGYFSGKPDTEYEPETVVRKVESTRNTVAVSSNGATVLKTTSTAREELVETGNSIAKRRFNASLNFANYPIYKLVDVVDGERDAVYVPELAFACVPEVGIKEYRNISVAIDIGFYDKPEQMDCILTRIRQDLLMYGIPPLEINLVSADTKWMNKSEYAGLSKIRIPAKEVTITDKNRVEYIGKTAIIGGTTKTIVNGESEVNTATEIDINSIVTKKVSIDHGIMLTSALKSVKDPYGNGTRDVYVDDVYEADTLYLMYIGNGSYRYLVEGTDFEVGDVISGFVTDASGSYIDLGKRYRVAGDTDRTASSRLYYLEDTFEEATGKYTAGVNYFNKIGSTYSAHTGWTAGDDIPAGIYVITNSEYKPATAEMVSNKSILLYVLESNHQYVEGTGSTKYKMTNIVKVNYASPAAINLVGKTFSYTPSSGGAITTTELTAEDVVLFANMNGRRVNISNEVVSRKYLGNWFLYNDAEGNAIGTRITETSHEKLSGKPGVICGITGEVSTTTFIEDTSLIKVRNYYQQYLEIKRQYDAEVEKNARLIEGQVILTNRIKELEGK